MFRKRLSARKIARLRKRLSEVSTAGYFDGTAATCSGLFLYVATYGNMKRAEMIHYMRHFARGLKVKHSERNPP